MLKSFIWLFEPSGPIETYERLGNWTVTRRVFEKLLIHFDRIYIFSPDSENLQKKLPRNCVHNFIKVKNRFLRILIYLFLSPMNFRNIFKTNNICANHLAIIPAIVAKLLYHRKIISRYTWRFYEVEKQKGVLSHAFLGKLAEVLNFKFSDLIIVSTRRLKEYVVTHNVNPEKIVVIPDFVDVDLFKPKVGTSDIRKKDKIKVLSVGRLISIKNHELAIKSLARLKKKFDCELTIVGQGPLREKLFSIARSLAIPLRIVSRVPNEDLLAYYNNCDFFLHSSKLEGCPVVVLEAMACGRPVIGTNVPGTSDIITNYVNGILCNPDPESISSAIELLVSNQDLRNDICKNARETIVRNYSLERNVRQIARSIESLSKKHKPRKTRIAFVTSNFSPSIGGVEIHVLYLAKNLKDKFEISVLTAWQDKSTPRKEQRKGIKIYRFPVLFRVGSFPICINILKKLVREKYDIIHIHAPCPISAEISTIYSILFNKPIIVTYHGDLGSDSLKKNFLAKSYNALNRMFSLAIAKKIIATTLIYVDVSTLRSLPRDKITVIPNGVDTSKFSFKKPESRFKRSVLYVGNLSKSTVHKGLDDLILSMRFIEDGQLVVVGKGDHEGFYRELVRDLGLCSRVKFVGFVPTSELPSFYSACDVFVLPTKQESFGIVFLEAMSCGRPIIGTWVGGIPEIIEQGRNGVLVPPGNPKVLADAIENILNKPEKAEKMGDYGRKICVKKYDWKIIADKVSKIYEEMIADNH